MESRAQVLFHSSGGVSLWVSARLLEKALGGKLAEKEGEEQMRREMKRKLACWSWALPWGFLHVCSFGRLKTSMLHLPPLLPHHLFPYWDFSSDSEGVLSRGSDMLLWRSHSLWSSVVSFSLLLVPLSRKLARGGRTFTPFTVTEPSIALRSWLKKDKVVRMEAGSVCDQNFTAQFKDPSFNNLDSTTILNSKAILLFISRSSL